MSPSDKKLVWLAERIQTPPFSDAARREAGHYLRLLQHGVALSMPQSRPMPDIGGRCHELRIKDEGAEWRILYRIDIDRVIIAEIFSKKTKRIPKAVIETCQKRLAQHDRDRKE